MPSLVVKLYASACDNPLFPNDPWSEAVALRHLAPFGLAPRLVAQTRIPEGFVLVYAHHSGTPAAADGAEVGLMLRRLHSVPLPAGLRCLPSGSDAILAQGDAILARCADHLGLAGLRPSLRIAATPDKALLHCDAVPSNILGGSGPALLIDWQCPAIGDPVEDLAIWLSPAMQRLYSGRPLSTQETDATLSAYGDHSVSARLRALAPAYHWRMAAYCLWRVQQGETDYSEGLTLELDALMQSC